MAHFGGICKSNLYRNLPGHAFQDLIKYTLKSFEVGRFMLTHLGLSFTLTTVVNVQTLPCLSHNHCKEESVKSVKIVSGFPTFLLDY